ncbi:DUF3718 domain-containing protein [Shewanella surugensis]|uniref:DUF3718 domain-containing protein n=1 Tax=Shewanella surugensis TaxID=212020 RepID=A0ABT0LCX8_9GAMM|nr:DUF3718 domain-containing protein [Shewanella surugensis]MCL1125187.1 DUF3718 domain-containing protein [Shewanella surugensis]
MRLLPTAMAALIIASSFSVPVHADPQQLVANICNYVQSDDKNRLRKKLKENRLKLRNIYSAISCDGQSLLRTALDSKSDSIGTFVAKRLSVKELKSVEADGKTIVDWAKTKGYASSAITSVIEARIAGS